MNSYQDLIVWQKSVVLAKDTYGLVKKLPKEELFGLSSQMRRAVVSIVSNIAEGFSRKSIRENGQFLSIAFGSSSELEAQLILAQELGFISKEDRNGVDGHLQEVRKILNSMLSKFRRKM